MATRVGCACFALDKTSHVEPGSDFARDYIAALLLTFGGSTAAAIILAQMPFVLKSDFALLIFSCAFIATRLDGMRQLSMRVFSASGPPAWISEIFRGWVMMAWLKKTRDATHNSIAVLLLGVVAGSFGVFLFPSPDLDRFAASGVFKRVAIVTLVVTGLLMHSGFDDESVHATLAALLLLTSNKRIETTLISAWPRNLINGAIDDEHADGVSRHHPRATARGASPRRRRDVPAKRA